MFNALFVKSKRASLSTYANTMLCYTHYTILFVRKNFTGVLVDFVVV